MITVHTDSHQIDYHPEYFLMRHFGAFIAPGARRIEASGQNSLAFANRDGSIVLVTANLESSPAPVEIRLANKTLSVTLPANSFNTIVCPRPH
jgi:glucosylceramidase